MLPNRTYYYRIEVNEGNNNTKLCDNFRVKSVSKLPAQPKNLRIKLRSGNNEILWDATDKITVGYYVYRSETGNDEDYIMLNKKKIIVTQNAATSNQIPYYIDKTIDLKKKYYYKVVGVNIFNEQGTFSIAFNPNQ